MCRMTTLASRDVRRNSQCMLTLLSLPGKRRKKTTGLFEGALYFRPQRKYPHPPPTPLYPGPPNLAMVFILVTSLVCDVPWCVAFFSPHRDLEKKASVYRECKDSLLWVYSSYLAGRN